MPLWPLGFQINVEAELLPPTRIVDPQGAPLNVYAAVRSRNIDAVSRTIAKQLQGPRVSWVEELFAAKFLEGEDGCDVAVELFQAGAACRDALIGTAQHRIQRTHLDQTLQAAKKWGVRTENGAAMVYISCQFFSEAGAPSPARWSVQPPTAADAPSVSQPLEQGSPRTAVRVRLPANPARVDPCAARQRAGRKLHRFFAAHAPQKVPNIAALLDQYAGREGELVEAYRTVYRWWDWSIDPTTETWGTLDVRKDELLNDSRGSPRVA